MEEWFVPVIVIVLLAAGAVIAGALGASQNKRSGSRRSDSIPPAAQNASAEPLPTPSPASQEESAQGSREPTGHKARAKKPSADQYIRVATPKRVIPETTPSGISLRTDSHKKSRHPRITRPDPDPGPPPALTPVRIEGVVVRHKHRELTISGFRIAAETTRSSSTLTRDFSVPRYSDGGAKLSLFHANDGWWIIHIRSTANHGREFVFRTRNASKVEEFFRLAQQREPELEVRKAWRSIMVACKQYSSLNADS